MYAISFSLSAPSRQIGRPMWRPRERKNGFSSWPWANSPTRWVPPRRELQRHEVEQRQLGCERLRGRDAHLEPGARVDDRVHLARDLRAHHVRDRERASALLAGDA